MRVIAGEHKGRRLKAVPGTNTRPTTDKVKESMFNIIGPFFDGGQALDLFAGTGSLGIESISRGIEKAVFIEQNHKALAVIRENVNTLGLNAQTEIFKNDANRALDAQAECGARFDLVFLDPPYKLTGLYEELITKLQTLQLLNDRAVVVAEHTADFELPEQIGSAVRWRQATYGEIAIDFYEFDSGKAEGMTKE